MLVFDEVVTLSRDDKRDTAEREIQASGPAVFVIMAYENEAEVTLRVSQDGASPASVEVESFMLDSGLEIAVFQPSQDFPWKVSLSGPQNFDKPRNIPLKIFRYDREAAAAPPIAARIAALRAWTAATDTRLKGADISSKAMPQVDQALKYFESADGDPLLAAWARYLRARFNYRQMSDLKTALADARLAVAGFRTAGDARNTARARFFEGAVLIELGTDATSRDPTAEEAARDATRLLSELRNDPALGPYDRARCVGYLGANYYNIYKWDEAREAFQKALVLYQELGYQHGRRQVLVNLGVLAESRGDNKEAEKYFDLVMPEIDSVADITQRILLLFNAGMVDTYAGRSDRAIERLLKALSLAQSTGINQYESLILGGLGRAYWEIGDLSQAETFLREALKIRRTLDAGMPLLISLTSSGRLARATGDIETALELHHEAESLSFNADVRQTSLLDIALDHAAAHDYERAIDYARKSLSVRIEKADFYNLTKAQLALAEMLLSQPRRTAAAIKESGSLIDEALGAAIRRSDIPREIAARRLKAQSLLANRDIPGARAEFERAIALIFMYRSAINNPELRAAMLDHEQKVFHGYVDLLMQDAARLGPGSLTLAGEAEERALRTLEWARALRAELGGTSSPDPATQAQVSELLASMASKRVRIASLQDSESSSTREIEILQLDIAQLRAQVDRLRAKNSSGAPTAASASTIDVPWPLLPEGVTQLSYALDTTRPYLWVRDATGIRAATLDLRIQDLAIELKTLARATHARSAASVDAQLARLSRKLLPAGALPKGTRTIEIVVGDELFRIPFAALISPENRSVVMISSMFNSRVALPPTHPRAVRFAALADEASTRKGLPASQVFPRLQGTGEEVRTIAAMFRARDPKSTVSLMFGAEGNAGNLKKTWYNGVDVIHFATHGLADLHQPLTSLMVLPALDTTGAPTYLTAGQVEEWRGDADLVYLSACDTAVGRGMQGAFLRAGARGVVATLWPVEDLYASQFASDFYRRYTAGTPAPQALSETQRDWMLPMPGARESEMLPRRMTAWAHAYYAQ